MMNEAPIAAKLGRNGFRAYGSGAWLLVCILVLAGCAADPRALKITKNVKPIDEIAIPRICIELDSRMEDRMAKDLFGALETLGFRTMAKQAAFGSECRYSLTYRVSWAGSMPKWPVRLEVSVYDNSSQIGFAIYDASRGASRPDKFGTAISKLSPLLEELFANVER